MKMKSKRESLMKATAQVQTSRRQATDDQIRQRAYEIFLARGASDGQDVQDWLRAERELQAQNNRHQASARSTTASGG
jgi:hypothetical protein